MSKDYSDVPDLETARRLLVAYDETTRKCADEIERLREALREIIETNHMDYVLMKTIAREALNKRRVSDGYCAKTS